MKVAKDSVLNSLVFAFERPSSTLRRLVTYDYFGYPADFLTQYQKALEAVTKQDVQRVAREYFQPSKLTVVAVANQENFGEPLTALNLPVKPLDITIPPPHETAAAVTSQTLAQGRELMNKAISFLGGAAKLNAVRDITEVEEAKMQSPQGEMALSVKSQAILPGIFREDQQRGPVTITLYVDPKTGWVHTPKGTMDLPAAAQENVRGQSSRQLAVLFPQLVKHQSDAVGTNDGKVQVKIDGGDLLTLKIDGTTGSLQSLGYVDEGGPVVENFSDWRKVDGVSFPFKSETLKDGKPVQSAAVSDIKVNTNLKPEELSKRP